MAGVEGERTADIGPSGEDSDACVELRPPLERPTVETQRRVEQRTDRAQLRRH
jgi:hypothetical protein